MADKLIRAKKKLAAPKVTAFNPNHSFSVSGVTRWRLCNLITEIPGVVFTRKPRLIGSSAQPHAEFRFRDLLFQVDDGGDMGGDGLWISASDGLAHPEELRELREHLSKMFTGHSKPRSHGR
jgi:hypothetical protein